MHQCTQEDFKKFYPPDSNAERIIQKLKDENALYCIDFKSLKMPLYGDPY